MADWLPLFHRFKDEQFIIFGGGKVADRKAKTLVRFNKKVRIISPHLIPSLQSLADEQKIEFVQDVAGEAFVESGAMVIAATDDATVNAKIAEWAKAASCLVNVADSPELSDFIFPAIIDRSPVMVAISSSSATPALTRYLRNMIDAALPRRLNELSEFVTRLRTDIRQRMSDTSQRQSYWRKLMSGPVPDMVLAGKSDEAGRLADKLLKGSEHKTGQVFLVGAGPGDPELLTLKAVRLIQQADVVLYDRLVSDEIMAFCHPDAQRIYVGKAKSDHAVPQDGINRLLVKYARQGANVLRLKGGDPFIFGRGGEEIEELAEDGIPFQIVPGITAASGCASYSGIPLTHRDYAQSVRFVTGHLKDGTADLPWPELIHDNQTLVIYMGLSAIESICGQLILHGMPADTPIALIEKGTTPEQKVHISTLLDMPNYVSGNSMRAPTLTIIGRVVDLHSKLDWRNRPN